MQKQVAGAQKVFASSLSPSQNFLIFPIPTFIQKFRTPQLARKRINFCHWAEIVHYIKASLHNDTLPQTSHHLAIVPIPWAKDILINTLHHRKMAERNKDTA